MNTQQLRLLLWGLRQTALAATGALADDIDPRLAMALGMICGVAEEALDAEREGRPMKNRLTSEPAA